MFRCRLKLYSHLCTLSLFLHLFNFYVLVSLNISSLQPLFPITSLICRRLILFTYLPVCFIICISFISLFLSLTTTSSSRFLFPSSASPHFHLLEHLFILFLLFPYPVSVIMFFTASAPYLQWLGLFHLFPSLSLSPLLIIFVSSTISFLFLFNRLIQ